MVHITSQLPSTGNSTVPPCPDPWLRDGSPHCLQTLGRPLFPALPTSPTRLPLPPTTPISLHLPGGPPCLRPSATPGWSLPQPPPFQLQQKKAMTEIHKTRPGFGLLQIFLGYLSHVPHTH